MAKKVLVLHSGGLDSTVCLLMALSRGHQVLSLGVDYGQTHHIELDYATAQCRQFDVERKVIRVAWDKPIRTIPLGRKVADMTKSVSPAFLPGRNGLFLMLACAEAAGVGATEVWTGINSVDFSGYPDCTPEFLNAFSKLLSYAIPDGPKVVAPLQRKSKLAIGSIAKRLGLAPGDTWSCYRPAIISMGVTPCGKCDACLLHDLAWGKIKKASPKIST